MADKHIRKCSTPHTWEEMSLEQKVETLGTWSVQVTEWLENLHYWQVRIDGVMKQFSETLDTFKLKLNGSGLPPKHPKDPRC